jgi:hypothetical protein
VKIEVNNNGFIKNSYFKVEFKEPEMKKDKKDSIEISREAREMQKLKVAPKNLFMIKEKKIKPHSRTKHRTMDTNMKKTVKPKKDNELMKKE